MSRSAPDQSWDRRAATRLLRNVGFAPSEAEVRAALQRGRAPTIEHLLGATPESPRHDELDEMGHAIALHDNIEQLRGWWLLRMVQTRRPLHARMALFWHNHFATSNAKVRNAPMMLQQLRTFERHGLGRFEDLLLALSQDPAMILWLDGDQNVLGRPNENFARELFELFALGVGNYTERDIKESARAFTGWHQHHGSFRFTKLNHDTGDKTVFDKTGPHGGEDIVRLTVAHPACSRFIATKLLREFLCPDPPATLVEELASQLRDTDLNIGAAVRWLLASPAMFEQRWYRARIKSPVEFAVGMLRSLEVHVPATALANTVTQMGQRLFEPPSVKGWDGQRTWLNSATMLVRLNTATRAVAHDRFQPEALRQRYELDDRAQVIEFCEQLTLDGQLPTALHARIAKLPGGPDDLMRHALRLLLTSPEYQMT
jgi:uncharacterized protein (DUF1800 family)